jgi:hypothetical protein
MIPTPPPQVRRLFLSWTLAGLLAVPSLADAPKRVTVRGAGTDLGETPIVAAMKAPTRPGPYRFRPTSDRLGEPLPALVFEDAGTTYLGFVLPRVKADAAETFELVEAPDRSPGSKAEGVELHAEKEKITVRVGGKLLTEYRTDAGPKPFYYPLIGPTGAPVTRSYPMADVAGEDRDHPHQRSMWFTHGSVGGVDFWSEQGPHGTIKETSRKTVVGGPAVGVIRTTDDWLAPDGRKVCEDERVVRFYDTRKARVLDVDVTLKATAGPVKFGDTKEGMFGLRVASSLDVDRKAGGRIVNAEGLTDATAWGKPSAWVDYSGPVDGKTVGIGVLNHPDSFRYPTTWHVRTYGLFAANPFGWHDFGRPDRGDYTLPEGASLRFRYRLILHEGGVDAADLPAAFRGYATPPKVEVVAD